VGPSTEDGIAPTTPRPSSTSETTLEMSSMPRSTSSTLSGTGCTGRGPMRSAGRRPVSGRVISARNPGPERSETLLREADDAGLHGKQAAGKRLLRSLLRREALPSRRDVQRVERGATEGAAGRVAHRQ